MTLYRLIDKDGKRLGYRFLSANEAALKAMELWPDQEQRDGDKPGWDIEPADASS